MSNIILTGEDNVEEENTELAYKATEADEERFFLIYHLNIQPSEAESLSEDYRKWLIARFIGQKQMEREAMQQQRMMSALGPNLKG